MMQKEETEKKEEEEEMVSAPDKMRMTKLVQSNQPAITDLNISYLYFISDLIKDRNRWLQLRRRRPSNWLKQ